MIKINIICVGNLKEKYLKDACAEYLKRLSRFASVNIIELVEEKQNNTNLIVKNETDKILKRVSNDVILLDVKGSLVSSEELAKMLKDYVDSGKEINFVIGGSYGVDNRLKEKSTRISFGKITLPHQLARVVLLEQVYRAFTINNNIVYHK